MAGGMSAGMSLVSLKTPDGYRVRWVIRQLSAQTLALRPRAVKMEYDLLKIMSLHNLPVSKPVYLDEKGKIFGITLPGDGVSSRGLLIFQWTPEQIVQTNWQCCLRRFIRSI